MRYLTTFLVLLFVLSGCSNEETEKQAVFYKVLTEDHLSYDQEQQLPLLELHIEEEVLWQELISRLANYDNRVAKNLAELQVDFDRVSLVVILEEFRYTCCNTIEISGILERNNRIVIDYHIKGHPRLRLEAVSQAIKVLEIPKSDFLVVFK